MAKNKIFSEFLDNEYNKNEAYNEIYTELKQKEHSKKTIINSAVSLLVIVALFTTSSSIYAKKNWEKEYEDYLARQIAATKSTINTEVKDDTSENLNMDYIYQNGIGVKINSILMTEYTCQMDVDFNVADENKENFKAFEFGFAIYDENKNIYAVEERNTFGKGTFLYYEKKLCEELGIEYNAKRAIPKRLATGLRVNPISMEDGNNIIRLELISQQTLPKSKKLYVRIFNIGYTLADFSYTGDTGLEIKDAEDFTLSDNEWQFEIEIPDKFYSRNYTELKLAENIDKMDIKDITMSSEGKLSIKMNTKYSIKDIMNGMYISDDTDNTYKIFNLSNNDNIEVIFDIGKDYLDKDLYLNFELPEYNISKKIQLIYK